MVRGVFAGCVAGLALSAPAHGGTVYPSYLGYRFQAEPGETNLLLVTAVSGEQRFHLSDLGNPVSLAANSGCSTVDADTVSCPFETYLHIQADDGNDVLNVTDSVPMQMVVSAGTGDDDLNGGSQDDTFWSVAGRDTIDGDGGSDTVRYSERMAGVTVDLTTGSAPDGAMLLDIENVAGTNLQDRLTGTPGDNVIAGGFGADVLNEGGGGFDTLVYEDWSGPTGLVINLVTKTNSDADQLSGRWEGVIGTFADDFISAAGATFSVRLEGRSGDDVVVGGDLDDTLVGGPDDLGSGHGGSDTLIGGGGADALYGNSVAGLPDGVADTASYDDGRASSVVTELAGGHQDGDFYSDISNLIGGNGNDLLVGDIGPNLLIGNNGADILVGADGVDELRGGLPNGNADVSIDVASYRDRGVPVVATLGGANPDGDLFSDISGLEGGGAGDTLTGDAFGNLLLGGAGNDTVVGLAGADDLQAGEGEDSLQARDGERDSVNCGPGMDTHDEDVVDVLTDCEDVLAVVPRPPALVRCVVPNVMRRTVARAKRLLNAKRCRLGKVGRVYSRKVRKGWIVSQGRRPGARLARNAKINVVVSRGRRR